MKRILKAALTGALLVSMIAGPAVAYGSDSGTAVCGSNSIYVRNRTWGETTVRVPSGTVIAFHDFASYTTRYDYSTQTGTKSWKVQSWTGGVSASSTYSGCWGT